MKRLRFSIAGLMAVVLACGVGVAALRYATDLWAGVLLTATLAVLGFALLGVAFRRGRAQVFWAGFALFGWGYLIASSAPWFDKEFRPRLVTAAALDALRPRIGPPQAAVTGSIIVWSDAWSGSTGSTVTNPVNPPGWVANVAPSVVGSGSTARLWTTPTPASDPEPFHRVGHILFALLAAMVGGLAARAAFGPRDEPADRPSTAA